MLPAPPTTGDRARQEAPPPPSPPASGRGWRPSTTTWVLAAGAAAGCAYLALADPNDSSSLYPACPFRSLTGYDCPGCGVTRALRALVTGHPGRALDHNALVVLAAVAGVVWFVVNRVRVRTGRAPLQVRHPARWGVVAGVVLVAFWVLRNVPHGPFTWFASGASGT